MSSKPKPARNRLRRSCDVCFKSKTKCDDHRPCNQCIRRKCEDRCLTSGQSPGVLDSIQRAATTPYDRRATPESRPTNGNGGSTNGTSTNGTSHEAPAESRETTRNSQQQTQAQNGTPYQSWSKRQTYGTDSPFAASLNYEHQTSNHLKYMNGNHSLEHSWTADGPGKGRTHYLWLLQKFSSIIPYIDDESRSVKKRKSSANGSSYGQPGSPKNLDSHRSDILSAVYHEIPKREVCIALIDLYFSTYAQIFPILDHKEFEKSYYLVMSSPDVFIRDINFVVMLLLVLLLGNTLLDANRQGVSSSVVLRWLDLVQSWQNKMMETASFGFEQIHTFVLFNLARQVTKVNPEADYICMGSAIRAAMINGTHKPPELLFGTGYTARVPWTALIELDLQCSLATGLLPTTATIMPQDEQTRKSSSLFINEIWSTLANTIHLRHDILVQLNSELKIKHQHAIDLARELTSVVGPVLKTCRKTESAFAYEYLNFVYKRFLFALHRPFALMDDPAYHFSQRICSSLSFQHIERICRVHSTPPPSRTPFENVLAGHNAMFWEESFQSAMFLCHSLLRTQSVEDEIMDTIMLGDDSHAADRAAPTGHSVSGSAIRMALHAYVPVAAEHLRDAASWLAEQAYLVPAITLAYLDVSKQFSEQKSPGGEWEAMWKDTQAKVVGRCLELMARHSAPTAWDVKNGAGSS